MVKIKIWKAYMLTAFLGMLFSFHPWFTFGINVFIASFIFFVLGCISFLLIPSYFKNDSLNKVWFFILCFAVFFVTTHLNFNGFIAAYLSISPVLFVFLLSSNAKEKLLNFSVTTLGIIFAVSLLGWFFHLLGFDLPYTLVEFGESNLRDAYIYKNHYLYLVNITRDFTDFMSIFERFSCVFLEPGYTGCLLAILLYLGGYEFNRKKWYNVVFLISLLFTLSLAGWMVAVFGFFMHKYEYSKNRLLLFLAFLVFAVCFYFFAISFNQGENPLNYAVIKRLTGSSEGTINWNRGLNVESYFYNNLMHSDEKWFGTSKKFILDANDVDWKSYIVAYGLFGFFSYVIFLYFPAFRSRKKKYELIVFSTILFLIFVQTNSSAFWMMYIAFMVLGVNRIRYYNRIGNYETY